VNGSDDTKTVLRRAAAVVRENYYGVLGTIDPTGPWTAVVAVFPTESGELLFTSPGRTRHGTAVLQDARAAMVIFDSKAVGGDAESLQMSGTVDVLPLVQSNAEKLVAARRYRGRSVALDRSTVEQVLNRAGYAIFRFTAKDSYVLDQDAYHENGYDARQSVDGLLAVAHAARSLRLETEQKVRP